MPQMNIILAGLPLPTSGGGTGCVALRTGRPNFAAHSKWRRVSAQHGQFCRPRYPHIPPCQGGLFERAGTRRQDIGQQTTADRLIFGCPKQQLHDEEPIQEVGH